MGKKRFRPGAAAAAFFLEATSPETIKLARLAMVGVGYRAQRLASQVFRRPAAQQTRQPRATTGRTPVREQVVHRLLFRAESGGDEA